MIPGSFDDIVRYWEGVGVERITFDCTDSCGDNEFSRVVRSAGLPSLEVWTLRFGMEPAPTPLGIKFGDMGKCTLCWLPSTGHCVAVFPNDQTWYANKSFLAFNQCLTLFDQLVRRIRSECPGESDDDWEKGDAIIEEIEREMKVVDGAAFESEEKVWPFLLVDING